MNSALPRITRLFTFLGGTTGPWIVERAHCVAGEPLPSAQAVSIISEQIPPSQRQGAAWALRGITSNERYVVREEKDVLVSKQKGLGRPASTRAALIPIRKTPAWWGLSQDERREIFEAQSHHIGIGLKYLPAVARRLHHCRDLGAEEPFDFITWFEYAPSHSAAFDDLVEALRASPEWKYVDREVDIRLARAEV
jgi:hypothetical protein